MRSWRFLALATLVCLSLAYAPAALANTNCNAPPGTAGVDQYCETLPTADGTSDVSQRPKRPLADVLPARVISRLRDAGIAGDVLLALPAPVADAGVIRRAARFDPQVKALLPGPGPNASSIAQVTAASAPEVAQGFGWVLVLVLFTLGGLSLWGSLRIQ